MSDDVKVSDETKLVADAPVKNADPKHYSEEEFKKVIAERDKAKERLRKIEEDDKKAVEAKQIEEGKSKELLTQKQIELDEAKKQLAAYNEAQALRRQKALDEIKDAKVKAYAEKNCPTPEALEEFLGIAAQPKIQTYADKSPHSTDTGKEYKNFWEYERDMKAKGLAS